MASLGLLIPLASKLELKKFQIQPSKTKMTMEKIQPFEDVALIENGDFSSLSR